MIQFKICMIGCYAVGKTSLVERFVRSIYSDDYHTTIGVKIDKATLRVNDADVTCVIWDIAGEDEFYTVATSYLRGMSGYFLVVDGTRQVTLDIAHRIRERINTNFPHVPFVLLANKSDLADEWVLTDDQLAAFPGQEAFLRTSARLDDNVEQAFAQLSAAMLRLRTGPQQ